MIEVTRVNILTFDEKALPELARSQGRVAVSFVKKGGDTCLQHLYQSGCGRVHFPTVDNQAYPEAVLINTAGGLTGGDDVSVEITVHEKAKVTVTGQAAEKIYKSVGPYVTSQTDLQVAAGAYLEWLPQETILFNQARLHRVTKVDIEAGARLLAVEATVLGRQAHGETMTNAALIDGWEIRREGHLVWFDRFRFDGNMEQALKRSALLGGANAFATIVLVASEIPEFVKLAREIADDTNGFIGVTSFDDTLMVVRVLNRDPYSLRKDVVRMLQNLRQKLAGAVVPMPAVWEV